MPLRRRVSPDDRAAVLAVNPLYGISDLEICRYELPHGELPPSIAAQIVRDELMLDGNARLNLATFVTTWTEPDARSLIADTLDRNIVDRDEYPQTAELEHRCINILARLWNAPDDDGAVGTSTTGSSEAAMLGGLALKHRWRARRAAQGRPTDRPNLVMGRNVQVCWEKFCRYFDVEPRLVPVEPRRHHLTGRPAVEHCDENTIGVVAILGSTFDGSYEPVSDIAAALDELAANGGADVPIHVDAASGGFVAPFLEPGLDWDFRLPRVASINASGHKYGHVPPGVGWALWRDEQSLPRDLVFSVDYLGGSDSTFSLNFSRPGAPVIAQYFNFLRLGHVGYERVQGATRDVARYVADGVESLGPFELLTRAEHIPVFAFKLRDEVKNYSVYDVSRALREHGWLVPAYHFPPNLEDLHVLRIVARNGFSRDLGDLLLRHMRDALTELEKQAEPLSKVDAGFHH